ncbi:RHS repeat domain-containing protein [Faucicola atlantae]|uniref:RHS repeat domain-containing protein n=1 Tax=Faucicola atlantae TaxID=34059 RepID=UPI0025AEE929|nr:RHS repeat-associated core domain-containing protein [Moraxella atlantae]
MISQGKQVGYFYDKHGRVKTKTLTPVDKDGNEIPQSTHNLVGYRESLQLFYSPNHELNKSITIKDEGLKVVKTVTHYYYDAFGRRIGKSSSTQKSSKLNQRGQLVRFPSNLSSLNTTDRPQRKNMLMLWDGNRQIQEITDDFTFTTVYEQNSFEPIARIVQLSESLEKQRIDEKILYVEQHVPYGIINQDFYDRIEQAKTPLVKIYHYHNNHLGTPQELSDDKGDIVWLSYDRAWGGSFDTIYKQQFIDNFALNEFELQPFKFQGQSLDTETGLHYNRFRYYDSDVGMFISRDPIGLMGGSNVFQYAPNPTQWIDPFGLAKLFETGTYGSLNGGDHVGDGLQAHELIRHEALVQNGLAQKSTRLSGNPSIALDLDHHTRGPLKDSRGIGGAHYHEAEIRQTQYSLGKNDIHPSMKREMDITQGSLRKAGVPTPIVKRLRKEANKFYRELLKKKSKCTSQGIIYD